MQIHTRLFGGAALALTALVGSTLDASAQTSFRVAVGDAAGSAQHELGKKFVEELEARTDGAYTAELFLNGQLGSEQNTVNDASMGLLDMSLLAINNITPFSPSVGIFTLPYVIRNVDEAEKLINSEIGQELVDNTIRDAGVRIIGWTYTGCRRLTNSKKPVSTVADLEGLVIRVPKNEIMIDSYNAWGINPTPMAWSETFTALQQGVVDGQDNPYLTIHSMKFYEVQKYITDICYVFSIEPLVVSEGLFQSLDAGTQEALLAAGQAATEHSAAFLRESEASIREDLIAKGMEISAPADDEKVWIQKATEAVWPKHYDSIGGKEKLDRAMEVLGRS
ncbi:MAG: TRAP transporter substrate-binding protein [Geminicoccaceae bacterium]